MLRGNPTPCHAVTMAIARPSTIYDCNGRWAAGRSYVYTFMARDGDGPVYVKVGRSDNPVVRLGHVQVGCPFKIFRAAMVKCLSVDQAKRIEAEMHSSLAAFASSGEWFRFDWSAEEERRRLASTMEVVFASIPGWQLEEIDVHRAAAIQRQMVNERQRRSRANRLRSSMR